MTPEEAKKRNIEQDAELAVLERKVTQLAATNSGPVLLAIVRGLVEMVCGSDGDVFRRLNKIRFYRGVLAMLDKNGIR